jgi:hypothetical protein
VLAGGSAGLADMAAEADRLGITLSDEAADNAALLNDTIGRLTGTVGALFTTVGSQLAPMVISIVGGFTEWVGRNRDLIVLLAKTAIVISSVVVAMKLITMATQAYATAQAVATALSGPAGWAKLAIGLGVAAAATATLASEFEAANSATADTERRVAATSYQYDNLTESVTQSRTAVKDYSSALSGMTSAYESFLPKADQVRNSLAKMTADFWAADAAGQAATLTVTQLEGVKLRTILGESGWKGEFDSITDELAVLRGEITETEQRFAKMAEFGVDARHIDALRAMNAERDKLLQDNIAKEQEAADEERRLMEQKRQDFLDSKKKTAATDTPTPETPQKQASNVGVDARSAQANQMIVDLVNRRGTPQAGTVEAKQLQVQQAMLEKTKEAGILLQQMRDEGRRRDDLQTKPFAARGRT